jgi:drug/metabolite transporter (DMT)-like permease
MTNTQTKKALFYIALGVILLGTGPMFVKYVSANGILVGFYRLFFASLMLSVMIWRHPSGKETGSSGKSGIQWAILGGLAFAVNISLWCSALNYTTASAVTLLDNTAPIWVGLFSWIVLKEKKTGRYWLGLLIATAGAALMIGWDILYNTASQTTGNLLGITSGVSYAFYILITKQARKYMSALRYSWITSLSGAAALFLASLILGQLSQPLPIKSLWLIFLMALTSQVIAWLLVNHALGYLPAAAASVALVGQPVVTTLLGIFILHEVLSPLQFLGAGVCLTGILMVQWALNQSDAQPVIEL